MIPLNRRRETGQPHRLRRALFWSLISHILAVSSLIAMGGSAGSVPYRGIVDVLLVGAGKGTRASSDGAVRSANRAPPKVPREDRFSPGRPDTRLGGDPPLPPKEGEGWIPVLPDPSVGSAGEANGRIVAGAVAPSPPAGKKSAPDSIGFPEGQAASVGRGFDGPGERAGEAAPVSTAKGVGGLSEGVPALTSNPGNPDGISRYGGGPFALRDRIQSRIVYPEEAVRRGQEGDVLLRIRIGADGVPGEIRIARSSGVRLLDDAARKGVVRAAPLPGRAGWVEVPVRFRLR